MFKGCLHCVKIVHTFGADLSNKAGNLINYIRHSVPETKHVSYSKDSYFWY